jgi:CDP-6-deoxy-D-xylo-4-hexulose-3-dehydrase
MWQLADETITKHEIDALAAWLSTYPRLTQGPLVLEFEKQWSKWLGVAESVMVSSGSTANMLLMMAVERRLGHKPRVGVSAVTWSTNVTPSILLGHEIVVLDIDPRTLGIDSAQAVAAIESRAIDVLFVTHLLGFNALSDEILSAADRNGVTILEDVCESHGARHRSEKVGTYGLGSSFSFYYGHHMSTIEGGMVSTNDPGFADEMRLLREHGLARASSHPEQYENAYPELDPRFLFMSPGLNFRSSDLNAFIGISQLERIDERIAQRNANLATFIELAPAELRTDFQTAGMSSFALPLIAENGEAAAAVRRAVDRLGIENRPVVAGNLLRQPFMSEIKATSEATPMADHVHQNGLYVGNGHHVDAQMIEEMTNTIREEIGR